MSASRDVSRPADADPNGPVVGAESVKCTVYRGARQDQMYLYLREGVDHQTLPAALLQRMGALTGVMELNLTPASVLARVASTTVIAALRTSGWYLQLPPDGRPRAHLTFGG